MIVHLTSAASLLADHELLAPPITSLKAFSAVSYTLAKMIAVWANGDVFILFERWLKICPDEHTRDQLLSILLRSGIFNWSLESARGIIIATGKSRSGLSL